MGDGDGAFPGLGPADQFYLDGQCVGGRWLDGDQTHQGRHLHLPDSRWTVQRFGLYRY